MMTATVFFIGQVITLKYCGGKLVIKGKCLNQIL